MIRRQRPRCIAPSEPPCRRTPRILRPLSGWWRLERRLASTAAKLPGGWAEDVEQLFTEPETRSRATEWNQRPFLEGEIPPTVKEMAERSGTDVAGYVAEGPGLSRGLASGLARAPGKGARRQEPARRDSPQG